jgi:hypothetical protein
VPGIGSLTSNHRSNDHSRGKHHLSYSP